MLIEIYDSFRKENAARTLAAAAHTLAAEEGVAVHVAEDAEPVVTLERSQRRRRRRRFA